MREIKVAHFAAFCPNVTGQYATVKDMIKAERGVGIDAQFIATSIDSKKAASSESAGKQDGWLTTQNPVWARGADIIVRHSCVPDEFANLGIPMVMALHGRPESTFIIEFVGLMKVYQLICEVQKDPRYRGWITFWKEHEFFHKLKVEEGKLYYVPAMVDLDDYNPDGTKVVYKTTNGTPNIIIADMWRHDMTPYAMLYAAAMFKEKYCPEAKVHVFGAPPKKTEALMKAMRARGVLGSIMGMAKPMCNVYRSGDFLITPHNIATRVVRESLACGLPIVAGTANKFTKWRADPRDIDGFVEQMKDCWDHVRANPEQAKTDARNTAEREFNMERAGKALRETFETILQKEDDRWVSKGLVSQKKYKNYEAYQKHQISKMRSGFSPGKNYQKIYRASLSKRLSRYKDEKKIKSGMSVLCLGARDGTEVKAFLDQGFFAVGVDLYPKSTALVLQVDFQKLPFPDNSLDIVFTNCIDHAYDLDGMLKEVIRVLKPGRFFIADFGQASATKKDKWASCRWDNFFDVRTHIRNQGFAVDTSMEFIDGYFTHSVCYRSLGGLDRVGIINSYIERFGYKAYLEIGCGFSGKTHTNAFDRVRCEKKTSVDPNHPSDYQMTSDKFFEQCDSTYDIIFIDGLHTAEQVLIDVDNALKHLAPNGHILLHDCNPIEEIVQLRHPKTDNEVWCGDVWKAMAKMRMSRDDLSPHVIDRDFGVGVIHKGGQTIYHEDLPLEKLTWEYLEENRVDLLQLREPEEWMVA